MKKFLSLAFILILATSGCNSLKDATGEYVVEAVTEKVSENVERMLQNRGLSLAQITSATDVDSNGSVDRAEIVTTVKETAKDFVLLEAKNYIEQKIAENTKLAATKDDVEAAKLKFINYLLGLLAAYLGKQIVSAKRDGKRDERIAILEKLINRDIDGDGIIGGAPAVASNPNNTEQKPAS